MVISAPTMPSNTFPWLAPAINGMVAQTITASVIPRIAQIIPASLVDEDCAIKQVMGF